MFLKIHKRSFTDLWLARDELTSQSTFQFINAAEQRTHTRCKWVSAHGEWRIGAGPGPLRFKCPARSIDLVQFIQGRRPR